MDDGKRDETERRVVISNNCDGGQDSNDKPTRLGFGGEDFQKRVISAQPKHRQTNQIDFESVVGVD